MDEKKNPGKPAARGPEPAPVKECVGEIIRRERERRDVSIYIIAKELRLNPRLIEALEANNYDLLPGDTYIRVYLRSLSKYLSLNAEEILERFFKERGLCGVDTLRKDSSTKINIAALKEKEKPNKTAILTASVFIILALFSYIATRQGWFSTETIPPVAAKTDSTSLQNAIDDSTVEAFVKARDSSTADTLARQDFGNTVPFDTAKSEKANVLSASAKSKFIRDSILKADARSKFIRDSILKADARSKFIRDSIIKADARGKTIRDSILKADARGKFIRDSLIKVDAKSKNSRDSILKADARGKFIRDSIIKADAKSKNSRDSILKFETKSKTLLDSLLKAEEKKKTIKDSILKAESKSKPSQDSVKTKTVPTVAKTAPEINQPMELKLVVTGRSAWVRVLSDGKAWRNILRKGRTVTFTAKDSFNLRTGLLEDVTYTLNGKKLDLPAKGIVALKIDRSGTTVVPDENWFKLTKGRF